MQSSSFFLWLVFKKKNFPKQYRKTKHCLKSWRFIKVSLNTVFYLKNKINNTHSLINNITCSSEHKATRTYIFCITEYN